MDPRVDLSNYPLLASLVAADPTGAVSAELERFAQERSPRHPRRRAEVVARLRSGDTQRSVVLWDISRSGVALVLPQEGIVLRAEPLSDLHLVLRTARGVVDAKVEIVRVVAIQDGGLHVAFRFSGLSEEDADKLDQLGTLLVSDLFRATADLLTEEVV